MRTYEGVFLELYAKRCKRKNRLDKAIVIGMALLFGYVVVCIILMCIPFVLIPDECVWALCPVLIVLLVLMEISKAVRDGNDTAEPKVLSSLLSTERPYISKTDVRVGATVYSGSFLDLASGKRDWTYELQFDEPLLMSLYGKECPASADSMLLAEGERRDELEAALPHFVLDCIQVKLFDGLIEPESLWLGEDYTVIVPKSQYTDEICRRLEDLCHDIVNDIVCRSIDCALNNYENIGEPLKSANLTYAMIEPYFTVEHGCSTSLEKKKDRIDELLGLCRSMVAEQVLTVAAKEYAEAVAAREYAETEQE